MRLSSALCLDVKAIADSLMWRESRVVMTGIGNILVSSSLLLFLLNANDVHAKAELPVRHEADCTFAYDFAYLCAEQQERQTSGED